MWASLVIFIFEPTLAAFVGYRPNGRFVVAMIVVAVVLALVITGGAGRPRESRHSEPKTCGGCRQANPSFAHFCRKCGRRFDGEA